MAHEIAGVLGPVSDFNSGFFAGMVWLGACVTAAWPHVFSEAFTALLRKFLSGR